MRGGEPLSTSKCCIWVWHADIYWLAIIPASLPTAFYAEQITREYIGQVFDQSL